jgi:Putative beta-barrel porin 2
MKKAIASAGLLALGAATAQTSLAQTSATGTPQKPWSISGTLRGFYDDNINTSPDGPGKQGSIGYEVIPQAQLNLSSGPTVFSASYIYSLTYYEARDNGKADQSHDFELSLKHNLNERYSFELRNSFVIAQEPEVLTPGGAVATPLRSNGDNLRNTASAVFHAQLTRLFGVVLAYNNTIYSYDENANNTVTPGQPSRSALLDRMENTFTLDTTWLIDPRTTGVIGYRFEATDYTSNESVQNDPVSPPVPPYPYGGPNYVPADSRNVYTHYFYVGADHSFRSDLAGSARVGFQYFDYYNNGSIVASAAGTNFVKAATTSLSPYVDLSIQYAYSAGGSVSAGFTYSHNPTDQAASAGNQGAGVTLDQESATLYGSASQKLAFLSPRLTGSVTGQFQSSTFHGGPSDGETDNFFTLGLNLSYQFTHLISGEIGYNYDNLNSDIGGRSYDRNRVYLGVTAAY